MNNIILAIFICYLIGSIPFAYLISKISSGIDIRKKGSRNVGATNVYRVVGKLPALIVLFLDIGKGFLPLIFLKKIYPDYSLVLGLSAIAGHIWSPFMKFKGGKGVATTIGVLLAVYPFAFLVVICVWIIIFLMFKIVSVASIVSVGVLPLFGMIQGRRAQDLFCLSLIAGIIVLRHKENIIKLFKGEEKKLF